MGVTAHLVHAVDLDVRPPNPPSTRARGLFFYSPFMLGLNVL